MARSSMAALISRERDLINDPSGGSQVWTDDQIQGVMDESRMDVVNQGLTPKPTYNGGLVQYLDYYSTLGNWEDDLVLKQYMNTVVTPVLSENIVGHWQFSANTMPSVYITGKTYDLFRSAADLLERWAAKWALSYAFSSDGQSFQRQQVSANLQTLAKTYRLKQRTRTTTVIRSDLAGKGAASLDLGPTSIDYMSSGH